MLVLVACGQKGPLQLPGQAKDTPWPVRTSTPANPSAAPQSTPTTGSGSRTDGAGGPTSATTPGAGGGSGTGPSGAAGGPGAPEAVPDKRGSDSPGLQ
jgi:predicted small lipoprotein YifL